MSYIEGLEAGERLRSPFSFWYIHDPSLDIGNTNISLIPVGGCESVAVLDQLGELIYDPARIGAIYTLTRGIRCYVPSAREGAIVAITAHGRAYNSAGSITARNVVTFFSFNQGRWRSVTVGNVTAFATLEVNQTSEPVMPYTVKNT